MKEEGPSFFSIDMTCYNIHKSQLNFLQVEKCRVSAETLDVMRSLVRNSPHIHLRWQWHVNSNGMIISSCEAKRFKENPAPVPPIGIEPRAPRWESSAKPTKLWHGQRVKVFMKSEQVTVAINFYVCLQWHPTWMSASFRVIVTNLDSFPPFLPLRREKCQSNS